MLHEADTIERLQEVVDSDIQVEFIPTQSVKDVVSKVEHENEIQKTSEDKSMEPNEVAAYLDQASEELEAALE